MKILHLAPYSPVPPIFGGALRVYHILKGLARHHEVTFLTIGTDEDRRRLLSHFGETVKEIHVVPSSGTPFTRRWKLITGAIISGKSLLLQYALEHDVKKALNSLFQKERFDLVLMEFPAMGQFDVPYDTITIMDEHNVEFSNLERMYKGAHVPTRKLLYFREYRKLRHDELDVCRKVKTLFVTSENDARLLDMEVPEKPKYVIPNGVDTAYFQPSEDNVEPFSMVYTGTMDYFPNHDAMEYFVDTIFPLIKKRVPEAKIYIVGKNPASSLKRRASKDVIVTGYVPDVRPYTRKAAVYVVPLRMGSGTRLKILEGLAMKKAIVTTTIGCEGIDVRGGVNVEIADDPESFAEKVIGLFNNSQRACALGESGYKLVKERYDWEVVEEQMEAAINSIVKRSGKSRQGVANTSVTNREAGMTLRDSAGQIESRPTVKVLMYHRIVEDTDQTPGYAWTVSQSQLRRQLQMLDKWGYTCISFQDYSLAKMGKLTLPRKPVILTFDDGYDEVYAYALPILKEFGVRGTVFVLGDRSIRMNSWEDQSLQGALLLDGEQIRELHSAGFEIGSHSMTHPNLTELSRDEAWSEITASKEHLEELINDRVTTFAYPFGAATPELERLVRNAGYDFGCGTYSGPPRFEDNVYNIRRIPITSSTRSVDFAFKMLTPYEYYAWLRWKTHRSLAFATSHS